MSMKEFSHRLITDLESVLNHLILRSYKKFLKGNLSRLSGCQKRTSTLLLQAVLIARTSTQSFETIRMSLT